MGGMVRLVCSLVKWYIRILLLSVRITQVGDDNMDTDNLGLQARIYFGNSFAYRSITTFLLTLYDCVSSPFAIANGSNV